MNGPIVRPADFWYIWGDALAELHRVSPHARIINLAVHGHSSHHPRFIEVYNQKLALMYFPTIDWRTGELVQLLMTPMQIQRLRLVHASQRDARWLQVCSPSHRSRWMYRWN